MTPNEIAPQKPQNTAPAQLFARLFFRGPMKVRKNPRATIPLAANAFSELLYSGAGWRS